MFEIAYPSFEVRLTPILLDPHDVIAEAAKISSIVFEVHKDIRTKLLSLKEESLTEKLVQLAEDYMLREVHEKQVMSNKIEEIQSELIEIVTAKRYKDSATQVGKRKRFPTLGQWKLGQDFSLES